MAACSRPLPLDGAATPGSSVEYSPARLTLTFLIAPSPETAGSTSRSSPAYRGYRGYRAEHAAKAGYVDSAGPGGARPETTSAGRGAVLVLAGLFFLGLGVLHYLSFRNAGEVLAFGWFGVTGGTYPWSGLLTPRSTGLAHFAWSSFPSFAAAASAPLLVSPLFSRREAARLCLASSAVFALFEAGQWAMSAHAPGGLASGRFDILDILALALGGLAAYAVLRLTPHGREHG